jgi:PHP family Zn ribbon phosphoesterase
MNWQVAALDNISLISNSDAHSLRKLGREANVFEIIEAAISYETIIKTIRDKDPQSFLYTIEFYPEEGKYHLDGHRDHKFSCLPAETKRLNGICPVCGKKLLQGVLHRVDELADRPFGLEPNRMVPFKNIIPLEEIIADTLGVGVTSKKVIQQYETMIKNHAEFDILIDLPEPEIVSISTASLAEGIMRVREGKVHIEAGYDGLFGKIEIFSKEERLRMSSKHQQSMLF